MRNGTIPTPTDMIFPSFLFIVGMALTLSFASRIERGFDRGKLALHLLRRSAIIFVLGLAINGFPDYDWPNMRLPGILQRIAICYLFGGLLYLVCDRPEIRSDAARRRVGNRIIAAVIAALLGIYWALLKLVPVPGFGAGNLDSRGNLAAYIDRAVFGIHHMWAYGTTPGYGVTFDPEGDSFDARGAGVAADRRSRRGVDAIYALSQTKDCRSARMRGCACYWRAGCCIHCFLSTRKSGRAPLRLRAAG